MKPGSVHDSDRSAPRRVVVIVGASSGIKRATAVAFAREGACVVVAARRAAALRDVAFECGAAGGQAIAVPTDITVPEQVDELVRAALARFGRIDVWIHCAAVLMMGRFYEVPADAFRQVMETNFFGRVHCTRAVLKHFRARGEGVIVDVNSVLGRVAQPYASSYVASKFAGRGFVECLREELLDSPGIRVCSIYPAPVDTPIYSSAANFTGRRIRPIRPLLDPAQVAERIVDLARDDEREAFAGRMGSMINLMHALAPGLTERLARLTVDVMQIGRSEQAPTLGNLAKPSSQRAEVNGGWRSPKNVPPQWWVLGLLVALSAGVTMAVQSPRDSSNAGGGSDSSVRRQERTVRCSGVRARSSLV